MSPWKCPHCGTPQAESARCWACSRSPTTCRTCKDFRRSIAGRLGTCAADKGRTVLTGDEMRECWQAAATAPQPFLGLFGSLEPAAAPVPPRPDPVPAGAPTAAVAAQRRWNEILAGSSAEERVAAHGGSTAVLIEAAGSTPGHADASRAGSADARFERPTTTWTPTAPVAATPSVLPAVLAPDPSRWRHPSIDERSAMPPAPIPEEPTSRRTSALSLLPATLANRLRQHVATRGWRVIPVEGAPSHPLLSPPATPPLARGATPIATARPVAPGRLVDAPSVRGTGSMETLGDQLRRAEQIRRERGLLDGERLRGGRGRDPGA